MTNTGPTTTTARPPVATRDEWLAARTALWIDSLDEGCPSCTAAAADGTFIPPVLDALREHDVTFAAVSRAPTASIMRYRERRGWTFPWYSSHGTTFNHDLQVTLDESVAPVVYNYRDRAALVAAGIPAEALRGDRTGMSVFLRHGDEVFPYRRQEDWEDSPTGWPQKPTDG